MPSVLGLVLQKASGGMATGSTDHGPSALPQPPCVFPVHRGDVTVSHKKRAPFIISITLANVDGFS